VASERKPGSNLGRAAIDWEAAFLYYAALEPAQRSYQAVADQFGVSARTVERHGLADQWKQRAAAVDRDAAKAAAVQLAKDRAEKLANVDKLIDASLTSYANQLLQGSVKVSPADLPRLHKLRTELWNDPTADPPAPEDEAIHDAKVDPTEHKLAVLRALQEAGILPSEQPDTSGSADQSEVA
jgi:hypothetical protein